MATSYSQASSVKEMNLIQQLKTLHDQISGLNLPKWNNKWESISKIILMKEGFSMRAAHSSSRLDVCEELLCPTDQHCLTSSLTALGSSALLILQPRTGVAGWAE